MIATLITSCEVSVKDVYGTYDIDVPDGYRVVRFGVPNIDEMFLASKLGTQGHNGVMRYSSHTCTGVSPRLIIEKRPELPPYTITVETVYGSRPPIPAGFREKDFRPPKRDEYFFNIGYKVDNAACAFDYRHPRIILEKLS